MNTPKWHVLQNKAGKWYWHKKSRNGKITATSGEDFSSKRKAIEGATKDAFPWFWSQPEAGEYVYKTERDYMLRNKVLIIHSPQNLLRVEDLRAGMKVKIVVNDGREPLVAFIRSDISGEIAIDTGDGYGFLTHDLEYKKDVVSVTEVTK